jgi:hypothetical protein
VVSLTHGGVEFVSAVAALRYTVQNLRAASSASDWIE